MLLVALLACKDACPDDAPVALELGTGSDAYRPMADGAELTGIMGPQFGWHFELALRGAGFTDDAEVQIGVDLPDAPPNHSWYVPFERPDFPDDDARFELFWTTVGRLLRSPVRFTSRRHRWLFCFEVTDVHLEMMLEGGWTHVQHPIEPSRGPNLNPGGRVVRVWTSSPWATGKSQRREPAGDGTP